MRRNFFSRASLIAGIVMLCMVPGQLLAAGLERVNLPAAPKDAVAFYLRSPAGDAPVLLRDVEALGLYRTVTQTPWEKGEHTFEGVLFADVLALLGLEDAERIGLVASDGFSAEIPREDWTTGPLMLATRRDGVFLTRRNQGPTRIVYPMQDHPPFADPIYKPRWIWLIATIEREQ